MYSKNFYKIVLTYITQVLLNLCIYKGNCMEEYRKDLASGALVITVMYLDWI